MNLLPDENQPGHLTADDIERYYRSGIRATRKVADSPECVLMIEPDADRIRLRTPATDAPADVSAFDHITFDVVQDYGDAELWFELSIDAEGNRYEAYLVLASVVDLLLGGVAFKIAVDESLAAFKDILARRQRLTSEQQVGLLGELLLLEHCISRIGVQDSLNAWLGAAGEEHDFVFHEFDAEIKSTRGEARVHMINSMSQLEPSPERPLYLVSIQLTAAGGAEDGATLAEVINRLRRTFGSQHLRVFDAEIAKVGWSDQDETLYPSKWMFRSSPRSYLVDEQFPAITPSRIAAAVPQSQYVVGVQYRLDVTQLEADPAPHPIDQFCQEV